MEISMSCCLLLRSATAPRPAPMSKSTSTPRRRANNRACGRTLLAILSAFSGIAIWRGLRDALDAIPDDNDDFTFH
jgi:hypothetical protein